MCIARPVAATKGGYQLEEAIAQQFGEFRAGKPMLPKYRRIFAKVRDLLTRFGNWLRGQGFNSVESIFARVESGKVGRRAGERADGGEARYAAGEMQPPASIEERASVVVTPRWIGLSPSMWISARPCIGLKSAGFRSSGVILATQPSASPTAGAFHTSSRVAILKGATARPLREQWWRRSRAARSARPTIGQTGNAE
jgi:hypothetical protein